MLITIQYYKFLFLLFLKMLFGDLSKKRKLLPEQLYLFKTQPSLTVKSSYLFYGRLLKLKLKS